MEEQRARQEAEARKTDQDPDSGPNTEATACMFLYKSLYHILTSVVW